MKLHTLLLAGYAVVFVLMIIIAGVTYQSITVLIKSDALEMQAQETKTRARLLMRLQVDMVAGVRGYALTGNEKFLIPYEKGLSDFDGMLSEIKELAGDSTQVSRIVDIEETAKQQQAALQEIVLARRNISDKGDLGPVISLVQRETGEATMNSIRNKIVKFVDAQDLIIAQRGSLSAASAQRSIWIVILGSCIAIILGIAAMFLTTRTILKQVGGEPREIAGIAEQIAHGNLQVELEGDRKSGTGIRAAIGQMLIILRENRDKTEKIDWLKTGLARLNEVMIGDLEIDTLSAKVISEIATYLDAKVGAFYLAKNSEVPVLSLVGSYAYTKRKSLSNVFKSGEGLVGQAALEKQQILLKNVPEDYVKVTSGLGERVPRFICVTPFQYEGRVKGVIEIGTLNEMSERELEYLDLAMPALAIAVQTAESRTMLAKSLNDSQQLSEELQVQQEELKASNEELEDQTKRLKESEERLKQQQEELEVTNEELEEKNDLLETQKREVERARKDIQEKADEVALASRYKSEFLANMSHELRTPLNSLLLLAQGLEQNKEGNLTADQVESVKIIHDGGSVLLNLINEILDLSKIEARRMDVHLGAVMVYDLAEVARVSFQHMAEEKGLGLEIVVREDAPVEIVSDQKRVEQIIRNLISNAIKFTERGSVTVTFGRPAPGTVLSRSGLSAGNCLAIEVGDTGIGIATDQQKIIFEAFQQADGGTTRKYGGTGLGLSISRELARLLKGEIQLTSKQDAGSTFTLYLPTVLRAEPAILVTAPVAHSSRTGAGVPGVGSPIKVPELQIEDDRERLDKDDRVILVIEDDPNFARLLYKKCHEKGFKCLATPTGEEGLALAGTHLPNAIILDLRLPGKDGWDVLTALKEDTSTRHIPVHIISVEEASTKALYKGAVGHATKPIAMEDLEEAFRKITQVSNGIQKRVLVVDDNLEIRRSTVKLIGDGDVIVDETESGEQALQALRTNRYDCVVLDLGLPDMDGSELLARLEREGVALPPIIIHTARDLTRDDEMNLRGHADSIVIKDVRSPERLFDEVSLFLHRVVSTLPEKKRRIIQDLHDTDALLKDKKVLIVDDDMRTIFALSRLLTERGMKPLKAENGEKALRMLGQEPDVDIVIMDIMMPVMDGYEAIGKIRAQERFRALPIIAFTAKAMPQDRGKCLEAGASDYLPKPVDAERLISMMRVWLYR